MNMNSNLTRRSFLKTGSLGVVGAALASSAAAGNAPRAVLPGASGGELLYNGIELPAKWPPKRTRAEILSYQPMPVPYLEKRPEVVPIDVGRQLFVDDFLIESTTLTRRFHKAQPYHANPVLRPVQREEVLFHEYGNPKSAMAFSDGCFFDPHDNLFKIWYRSAVGFATCYATSEDGINWKKPRLDVVPGSNTVLADGSRDSTTVWLDHEAKNPAQRFKLFQYNRLNGRISVHTSPDGIHWSGPTWGGPVRDRSTMFYNPFRQVWVFSIKSNMNLPKPAQYRTKPYSPFFRARKYWEAKDFVLGAQWKGGQDGYDWPEGQPQFWVGADRLDGTSFEGEPAELYNLDGAPYESVMLGLFSIWYNGAGANPAHKTQPKINQLMLGFSRDGFHWDRPFREPVVSVSNVPGTWNYGNVQSVGGGCLVVGDRLYLYHSGRTLNEETTGLAFFRRDGFASMETGANGGTLTTRPLRFSGRHLFVNLAAPQGELKVEVLDRAGEVIAPFTAANCNLARGDKTLLKIDWQGGADLTRFAGQSVRFRFHLRNGALYAFWVSPDASGASHGYIAAGGPGFTGPRDTVGAAAYTAARAIAEKSN